MTQQEKYADKIAKLLAKAESTTPEEAEQLYAKAQELMTQYAIDEAMIAAVRGFKGDDKVTQEEFVLVGIYRFALSKLTHYVLINNGIKVIQLSDPGWRKIDGRTFKETVVLVGVGFKSDLDRARTLQTSLMLQAMTTENLWWKENQELYKHEKKGGHYARRQFLLSFAQGAYTKLSEATARGRKAAEEEHTANSVALVLRDKSLIVQDEYDKLFPDRRKTSQKLKAGDRWAANHGFAAGQRADVGQPGMGDDKKKELN